MNRLPGLDLLRAIAIVWVMLFHARVAGLGSPVPEVSRFGWMGVDLFFVLSGFLIGSQLLAAAGRGEPVRFAGFYRRRAFRILPAYAAVVVLYYTVPAFRETPEIQPLWQFLTFTENLLIDYSHNKAFSHVWSLCVEEHFYLLFPFIVWLLTRRPSVVASATVAVAVVALGMCLRGHIWFTELEPIKSVEEGPGNIWQRYFEWLYYPSYTRLDGLLMGVLLAAIKTFRPQWWARWMRMHAWLLAAGAAGLAASIGLFQDRLQAAPSILGYPLLALSLALIVAALASPHSRLGRGRVPGAAAIAAISYSLYLSHKAVFHLVTLAGGDTLKAHGSLAFLAYSAAALAGGCLLYWSVERPMLRLRDRQPSAAVAGVPVAG